MAKEKETEKKAKEVPHLINMDLETIVAMVNRVAAEYAKESIEESKKKSAALDDNELFNLFFALEFLFKTAKGAESIKDLTNENDTLSLHLNLTEEMQNRLGEYFDDPDYELIG
jgi:hypothetical protein